ncbi:hypothetical protein [Sphingomonas flavalba]|uniref:hypothetical protein n=1 Tax=Sphingomonas flavalba TaxID=2559804 RepID=UPI00109DEC66|nr:hypothetical protein [Sphingomonas flavalba]
MNMVRSVVALPAILAIGAAPALSANPPAAEARQASPDVIEQLLRCQDVAEPTERLACFDRNVAAMRQARDSKSISIVDQMTVKKAERGVFGFAAAGLSELFGGEGEGLTEIESTISEAQPLQYGKWRFVLAESGTWVTTEPLTGRQPKAGAKVTVKRGAFGSYILTPEGGRSVRVKREN